MEKKDRKYKDYRGKINSNTVRKESKKETRGKNKLIYKKNLKKRNNFFFYLQA